VRDVAHVRDGYAPQTNMVRVDGRRSVLMNVLKTGNASTIDIIDGIKQKLPQIRASLPPELKIAATSDQSVFVRSAIDGVIREAAIAAALTGLLILLFLGSWRSTLIITISIPLSILASIACLSAIGQTINIMTLGGLALAVGILVDDATVTIENINYHLESGKDVETAILDGAQQIALPALVSTLCICIVFIPMFLLAASRSSCSYRWLKPLCLPCSPPICCRAPWCRRSPSSGSRLTTSKRASAQPTFSRAGKAPSNATSTEPGMATKSCLRAH